ncbi:ArsR/SmtB family transcription factor [Microbacterium gorillae]|uniref:ArsR/SmtB family transcription factor n=1 Tax=Microbacterium gorillae TaxID=1231063 RepID=UPI00058FF1D2|nr:metalloregulator ArsR/SmtB family transcription factor [Microbacterium gorillae]
MPSTADTVLVLHALADPHRLRILDMLGTAPRGVTDLARALPITRQGTAKHLTVLRDAGLVDATTGREAVYRVRPAAVAAAAATLSAAADRWSGQLTLLKQTAEAIDATT